MLNRENESACIGLALYSDDARAVLTERVRPEHFAEPAHKEIWALLAGGVGDVRTLVQRLGAHPGFEDLGGLRYLANCVDVCPPLSAVDSVAESVIEGYARRSLADVGKELQHAALKAPGTAESLLHDAEKALGEIARHSGSRPAAVSAGLSAMDMLEDAYTGAFQGHSVGIEALDHVTAGLRPADFWVIAGRTSMGKSVLATSIAKSIAEQGRGVLFFSLEMPLREVQARLIADIAYDRELRYDGGNVRYGDILKGRGDGRDRQRAKEAAAKLAGLPIAVNDLGGLTIAEIRSQATRQFRAWEKAGIEPGAIIIDHIGLVRPERRTDSKAADTTEIVNELKPLAKLVAPVIGLAQVNRNTESRTDKRPTPADLNWSGAIEQDADLICFLYREAYYLERSSSREDKAQAFALQHELELIIAKNRSGPLCTVKAFIDIASNAVRAA